MFSYMIHFCTKAFTQFLSQLAYHAMKVKLQGRRFRFCSVSRSWVRD